MQTPTPAMMRASQATIVKASEQAREFLEAMSVRSEYFQRVALNAILQNPAIAMCDQASLRKAFLQCAEARLLPDGKQAAIVPFKNQATVIKMVDGLLDLARQAIPGIVFQYDVILEEDDYEDVRGFEPKFSHKPSPERSYGDFEKIVAAYAIAWIPGAQQPEFRILYWKELRKIRETARTRKVWNEWPHEMAMKSALRRVCKKLPTRSFAPGLFDDPVPEQELRPMPDEPEPEPEPPAPAPAPRPQIVKPQTTTTPPEAAPPLDEREKDWGEVDPSDVGF